MHLHYGYEICSLCDILVKHYWNPSIFKYTYIKLPFRTPYTCKIFLAPFLALAIWNPGQHPSDESLEFTRVSTEMDISIFFRIVLVLSHSILCGCPFFLEFSSLKYLTLLVVTFYMMGVLGDFRWTFDCSCLWSNINK